MNTQTQRYLDPTNDSDIEKLKEFINNILDLSEGCRIKEIQFALAEHLPGINKEKSSISDLKVRDEAGHWYIIKMQKKDENDLRRLHYDPDHSYIQQLEKVLTDKNVLPIVVISLIKSKIFGREVPNIYFHDTVITNKPYTSYVFIEVGDFKKHKLTNIADELLYLFKDNMEASKQKDTEIHPQLENNINNIESN